MSSDASYHDKMMILDKIDSGHNQVICGGPSPLLGGSRGTVAYLKETDQLVFTRYNNNIADLNLLLEFNGKIKGTEVTWRFVDE